jgi:hypothetical protein
MTAFIIFVYYNSYALEGLPNKIMAAEYELALPDEKKLIKELQETRKKLLVRGKN